MVGFKRTLRVKNAFENIGQGANPFTSYVSIFGNRALIGQITAGKTARDTSSYNQAVDEAKLNFVKSYRKAKTTWSSGQFIGELRETVEFLKSPAKSLLPLTESYLKNIGKNLRKWEKRSIDSSTLLKMATDSWLAYKFGAAPMLADIRDASEALRILTTKKPYDLHHIIGTGKGANRLSDLVITCGNNMGYGLPGIPQHKQIMSRNYKTTAQFRGVVKAAAAQGVEPYLSVLGLTPDSFFPTLYEICPFSWMADYFSNLGGVIDACSVAMIDLVWSDLSTRQVYTAKAGELYRDGPPSPNTYVWGGAYFDEHVLIDRRPYTGWFVPSLRLKIPGLTQGLNVAAVMNSITSLAGRKPSRH
jgi:hypothetical protein